MKKNRKKAPKLEDLIPDEDRRQEILGRMYKGDKLLGEKGYLPIYSKQWLMRP